MAEAQKTITVTQAEKDNIVTALKELAAKHTRHSKNLGIEDVQQIYARMARETEQLIVKLTLQP